MDYEKKYKGALLMAEGIIRYYKEHNRDEAAIEDLEVIFPELKESEDERIRKAIIGYIDHGQHYGVSNKDMIAWLEKQGENAELSQSEVTKTSDQELEKQNKQILANSAKTCKDEQKLSNVESNGEEWSKEDERIHQCLIRDQEKSLYDVRNDKYGHSEIISDLKEMYRERINWLESIKERLKGE